MPGDNSDRFKKIEIDLLGFNRAYKITFDTTSTDLYQKYIRTVEEMIKMIKTLEIDEPTFEEIAC